VPARPTQIAQFGRNRRAQVGRPLTVHIGGYLRLRQGMIGLAGYAELPSLGSGSNSGLPPEATGAATRNGQSSMTRS
jgi:hypothetical protein